MKGLRSKRSHTDKSKAHKRPNNVSNPSVNYSDPSSTGDCSILDKNLANGNAKENILLINSIPLGSSIQKLDAKSTSLTNESFDTSKINLLPSDSCSVLMKQSVDRISNSEQTDIYKRLDAVVRRLERLLNTNDSLISDHSGIVAFNDILVDKLSYYLEVSASVGELALEQAKLIKESFDLCLNIMQMSRKYSKPSSVQMSKIMQPLSLKLSEIAHVANRNRGHPLYHPLLTISDSVSVLSWINMSCPAVFVRDMENATKVSANATTQLYRESMPLYAEWIRAWLRVISCLRTLVCDFYPVGLIWCSEGANVPSPPPSIGAVSAAAVSCDRSATVVGSSNSRREWKRQDDGKAFNRDVLLSDISRTRLGQLKHVEGFSYEA
nr:adenylyl cyclase associated protein [Hymenolepis microstoma]